MPKQKFTQDVDILNIRLPDDIIGWLDSLIEAGIYSSRSEAVRDLLRNFINEND